MISLAHIKAAWNRFFFEPFSPLPVAVYRAVLGFVVLVNQLLLAPDLMVWYGPQGALTPETALKVSGGSGINLLRVLPETEASVWLVFGLSVLFAFALMIGLFTRVSAAALFLILVTFSHRNPVILMSGDSFLRIATFYLIFSQAGAALSVDRWLRMRRRVEQGRPPLSAPWAMRLLQLQLSLLYLYAFIWKISGTMWLQGTAIYYTSRLPEFWRFPVPYALEHMWTLRLSSWWTLVVEFALGTLIWVKELRYPVLIAGVLLHAGIEYSMNIPMFGMVMTSAYLLFVEPAHLERALEWIKSKLGRFSPYSPSPRS